MASGAFEPPPTYAEVILIDEVSRKPVFNPIWLKWFIDLAGILSISGGGGGTIQHNSLGGLQGGTANEYYHLTSSQQSGLTGAADTTLHFHASDRALANATGTLAVGNGGTGQTAPAGVYTPTLTGVTNIAASTAYQCQYLRLSTVCIVSGKVDIDPTAPGATALGISLPVASNFGAAEDCGGTAFASGIAGQGAALRADAANDRAEMAWVAADITNQPMYFTFMYRII